tara:strand:- start:115 stop:918 length:804 start_codon:yes stop_codon:yes gene_type:complete
MKILICGDVVGRSGREIVEKEIPILRKKEKIDFVVLNGENAASGFGITKKICEKFYSIGIDVITSGNHIWDQKEILDYINKDLRLLRPCNFPMNSPGSGYGTYKIDNGKIICVINVMCRLFMDSLESPFESVKKIIELIKSKYDDVIILVDVHGESTSEKMALAHFFDGQVNAIFGTHTHVPTADLQVLEKGSFFQTDLGMCGDYDSVIGMKKENSILKFTHKHLKLRLETASGQGTLSGTIIEINDQDNSIKGFNQILRGGKLDRI